MMTDPLSAVVATTEESFRALLVRSWTLLLARTPPDDAAAIAAACDLQRQLIQTGTAWLALLDQVRALEHEAAARQDVPGGATAGPPAAPPRVTLPVPTPLAASTAAVPAAPAPAAPAPPPRRPPPHRRRSARRHRTVRFRVSHRAAAARLTATGPAAHAPLDTLSSTIVPNEREPAPERVGGVAAPGASLAGLAAGGTAPAAAPIAVSPLTPAATPPAPTSTTIDQVPLTAAETTRRPTAEPTPAEVPATGRRVCPLVPGGLPPRARLTAMAFHGTAWQPVTAWRRLFQQVLQTLQRSDPARFAQLATELTLQHGRRLFNRQREENLAPLDAGGGWYTTGQIPPALILQRLQRVLAWWDLPLTALEVELAPFPMEETPDGDLVDATGAVEPTAAPRAGLDEPPPFGAAPSPAAPITAPGVVTEGARSPNPSAEHATPRAGAEAGNSPQPAAPAVSRGQTDSAGEETGIPPQRRSRIYSAVRGAPLAATEVAPRAPLELDAVPGLVMPPPALAAAERPAAAGGSSEPSRDPLAARPAAPRGRDAPEAPPDAVIPDAVDNPPPRRNVNVRWVETASGTSLPLRPAPNDE